VLNTVESSPNLIINSIDDGVSGKLTDMENHAIGKIIIAIIVIMIPPPINNLNVLNIFSPRSVSNFLRKLQMH
jgi:hypothetical protein